MAGNSRNSLFILQLHGHHPFPILFIHYYFFRNNQNVSKLIVANFCNCYLFPTSFNQRRLRRSKMAACFTIGPYITKFLNFFFFITVCFHLSGRFLSSWFVTVFHSEIRLNDIHVFIIKNQILK